MADTNDPRKAASTGDYTSLRKLLAQQAVSVAPDDKGRTVLHDGCASVFPIIVSDLLKSGMFDLSLRTNQGFTPLHLATGVTAVEKLGFVYRVTGAGDRSDAENRWKRRLVTIERKAVLCVRLLRTHGAAIESTDNSGLRPVDYAKQMGFDNVFKILEAPNHSFAQLTEYSAPKLFVKIGAEGTIYVNETFVKLEDRAASRHELEDELDFVADQGGYLSSSIPSDRDAELSKDARDARSVIVQAMLKGIRPLGIIEPDPFEKSTSAERNITNKALTSRGTSRSSRPRFKKPG